MGEFLKNYFVNNFMYLQLIPAIVGLIYIKKFTGFFRYFIIFLWIVIFNELWAKYYGMYINIGNNQIWYNIYNFVNFLILLTIYYKYAVLKVFRNSILLIATLYICTLFYEFFILDYNYFTTAQVIPFFIGGIGILICVFFYFYQTLISDNIINVKHDFLFWLSIGYFVYYLIFIPFKMKQNYFATNNNFQFMFNLLIIGTALKGIFLIFGFIWHKKQTTRL